MSLPSSTDRLTCQQLQALVPGLRAALVSDALDSIGMRDQCLPPQIRAIQPGQHLVGYAFTVAVTTVSKNPKVPYVGLLKALDDLSDGDIFIASGLAEGTNVAIWGELISEASKSRGALGAVCNGYGRDTLLVRNAGFPAFTRGSVPYDSNGRSEVVNHGEPIRIGEVLIYCGDLVVGDDDGVIIVPRDHIREVIEFALAKGLAESKFRNAVRAGAKATEAFQTHQVL